MALGVIIGDEDGKRELFFSVGVDPKIFLFLEQIAPSCAVYTRVHAARIFAVVARITGSRNFQNV